MFCFHNWFVVFILQFADFVYGNGLMGNSGIQHILFNHTQHISCINNLKRCWYAAAKHQNNRRKQQRNTAEPSQNRTKKQLQPVANCLCTALSKTISHALKNRSYSPLTAAVFMCNIEVQATIETKGFRTLATDSRWLKACRLATTVDHGSILWCSYHIPFLLFGCLYEGTFLILLKMRLDEKLSTFLLGNVVIKSARTTSEVGQRVAVSAQDFLLPESLTSSGGDALNGTCDGSRCRLMSAWCG